MIALYATAANLKDYDWKSKLRDQGIERVIDSVFVMGSPTGAHNQQTDVIRECRQLQAAVPGLSVIPGWSNPWSIGDYVAWFDRPVWTTLVTVLDELAANLAPGSIALDLTPPDYWTKRYPYLDELPETAQAMRPLWAAWWRYPRLYLFPDADPFPAYPHSILAPAGTVLCDTSRFASAPDPVEDERRAARVPHGYRYLPARYGSVLRKRAAQHDSCIILRPVEDDAPNALTSGWYTA